MNKDSWLKDLVVIRYVDHVLFNRTSALVMTPQVRETVGLLVYECEQYVTIVWDYDAEPPTLKGGDPKASGLVLLKSDILELKKFNVCPIPLERNLNCHLNCQTTIVKREYALLTEKRKTQQRKRKGESAA